MHYGEAVNAISWRTNDRLLELPFKPKIGFVSPVLSTVCAAWTFTHRDGPTIETPRTS